MVCVGIRFCLLVLVLVCALSGCSLAACLWGVWRLRSGCWVNLVFVCCCLLCCLLLVLVRCYLIVLLWLITLIVIVW